MTDTQKPKNTEEESRLADFLYEALFLKRTPRSGYKFLGRGEESVAEHSFGVAMIAYTLAKMAGLKESDRILRLALFHDLAEARTGDLNYMNKRYVAAREDLASRDMFSGLPFAAELLELSGEWTRAETRESQLARDADQIDLLAELSRHKADGSKSADEWIRYALLRLKTPEGKALASAVLAVHPDNWWFEKKESFWVSPKGPEEDKE